MSDVFKACSSCLWTFKRLHSDCCPQCGSETKSTPRVDNRPWLARQNAQAQAKNAERAEQVQCCFTAKHTRGWNHDTECPEYTVGF